MGWRRCPSCQKGCSVEQGDPEPNLDLEDLGEGKYRLSGEVRLVLLSGCCGDEIAESTQEVPEDADNEFTHPEKPDRKQHELEIDDESAESDVQTTGAGRDLRTFYGASITATGQVQVRLDQDRRVQRQRTGQRLRRALEGSAMWKWTAS